MSNVELYITLFALQTASLHTSLEALQERYKEAKHFTSDVVFGVWDGYVGPVVRDEVIRCNKTQQNKDKAKVSKEKIKFYKLATEVSKIRHQQALDSNLFLTNKSLNISLRTSGRRATRSCHRRRRRLYWRVGTQLRAGRYPTSVRIVPLPKTATAMRTWRDRSWMRRKAKWPCNITHNTYYPSI